MRSRTARQRARCSTRATIRKRCAASLADGGYDELVARRDAARDEGRLYGIGFAAIVEPSVSNMGYITTVMPTEARKKAGPKNGAIASATVSVDLLGGVVVTIASTPAGQGHMTVCAQVVADVLGLDPKDIVVNVEFDTHKDAWSVAAGNYSSRFAGAVAGTVHLAAMRVRDKLSRIVAKQFACTPDDVRFDNARIYPKGGEDRALPFGRVASNAPHWAPALLPEGEEPGLRETVFWTPPNMEAPDENDRINTSAAYGFAFDMCGVEVDRATGRVRIDRYVTAHDAGTLLNPALADGQIRGAFAQGLGAALMEEFRYGADGSFQSGTLADYLMPTTCEVPDPVIVHLETPSPFTPLGAKGLGEGNNMSTPPCIANAVADALGVDDIRLPLTPSKVMALIGIDDPEPSRPELREAQAAKPARPGGKALTAQGTVDLPATPEAIFAVLLNPDALAKVIPGCHALEATAPNQYRADVTVGVGMIKARFEARIGLSDIEAPHRLRLAGAGYVAAGKRARQRPRRTHADRQRYAPHVRLRGAGVRQGRGRRRTHARRRGEGRAQAVVRIARSASRRQIRPNRRLVDHTPLRTLQETFMKPAPFDYLRAMTTQDALDTLAQTGEDARILAGGQSLMAVLNMRLAQPRVLIDISRTDELNAVRVDNEAGHLVISAAATQGSVEWRKSLRDEVPLLAMAFPHISHFQVRNRGTVCGSVAHADPSAELPLVLTALGGDVMLRSKKKKRVLAAADFFLGMLMTARESDEIDRSRALPAEEARRALRVHRIFGAPRRFRDSGLRRDRHGRFDTHCGWGRSGPADGRTLAAPARRRLA